MASNPTEGLFYPADRTRTGAGPAARLKQIPRRLVFRWAGWGALLAILAQSSTGFLEFFTPKKIGAFGGLVNAGNVSEIQVGDVKMVREGKFYLSRVPEGFFALWWKCPHLGCTVPWRPDDPVMEGDSGFASKARFNCPCHGSIYNRYGQILQGPAPRPMDRFPVDVRDGKIFVSTGPDKAISRARAAPEDAVKA